MTQQLTYGQQNNRQYCWEQACHERKVMKDELKDLSKMSEEDVNWIDYRYMQLCEDCKISTW